MSPGKMLGATISPVGRMMGLFGKDKKKQTAAAPAGGPTETVFAGDRASSMYGG
jgi:hypothetical protein